MAMTDREAAPDPDPDVRPSRSRRQPRTRPRQPQDEHQWLIETMARLVEPLGRSVPPTTEVVLHDLSRLPHSIVAVHGDVTGRQVGDPATDLLLERATSGELHDMVGYRTRLPDGRELKSTTMVVRDSAGTPVAALCINSDLSMWSRLGRMADAMTGGGATGPDADDVTADRTDPDAPEEVFARDVDELAAHLIHRAIRAQGVPVDLMKKEHKVAVVRDLRGRGVFLLRDAVEMVAASLMVTRFTIYNYLNELGEETPASARRSQPRRDDGKS